VVDFRKPGTFRDVERVIDLDISHDWGDIAVHMLALTFYRDGFGITFRIERGQVGHYFWMVAYDESGGAYPLDNYFAGPTQIPGGREYQGAVFFAGKLPESTASIRIEKEDFQTSQSRLWPWLW